jgi:hypothetical protein
MKNFEVVAHNPLVESRFNLPRGSNGGMAAIRDCVYVGSNIPYQPALIVDMKDMKKPAVVGEVPGVAWKAMGVEAFDGIADLNLLVIPARGADVAGSTTAAKRVAEADKNVGLVVYDVTDCRKPTIVAKIDAFNEQLHYMTLWRDPVKTDRVLAAVAYSQNPEGVDVRIWDLTGCPKTCSPKLVAEWGLRSQLGVPQSIVTKYEGGTRTDATNMHEFSFSIDGKRMHVAQYRYGYFQLDSSALAEGRDCIAKAPTSPTAKGHCITVLPDFKPFAALDHNTHGATKIPGRPYVALQYEDTNCPYGGINLVYVGEGFSYGSFDGKQVVEGGGGTGSFRADLQPLLVGSFNIPENNPERCPRPGSAVPATTETNGMFGVDILRSWKTVHNTLAFPNLLIVTWYGGGLRAVDITNPQAPYEVGFYFNKPEKEVRWCYSGYAACSDAEFDAEGVPTRSRSIAPPDILSRSFPITMNGYVVYTDSASGLFVMKYTGPHAEEIPQQGICAARAANTIKVGFDPCPPYK